MLRNYCYISLLAALFLFPVLIVNGQKEGSRTEANILEEEFIRSRAEVGDSHASGNRLDLGPVILSNPVTSVIDIRVGIYYSYTSTGTYSEFASLNHPLVQLTNTDGNASVIDQATGTVIAVMQPGQIFEVSHNGISYSVSGPNGFVASVAGPVRFTPDLSTNNFQIESIRRSNILVSGSPQTKPLYRGSIEISRGSSTAAQRVNLVNIIEVESYVRGVVANESIASFHIEALKSQATAARGYAVANIGNYIARGYPFDIVDSSTSQVYRGVISEHPNAIAATDATTGLVASYQGRIISALYSSSFGGYSDSNHWIFNLPAGQLPGTNVTPYLIGIFDGAGPPPDLTDAANRQFFWTTINTSQPNNYAYDMCGYVNNRFSRWRITIPASDIKSRLAGRSVLISGDTSGDITGIEVLQRMTGSNRIAQVRITLTSGVVEVRGWDNLRNVIGKAPSAGTSPGAPCGSTTIAASFVLTNPALVETVMNPDGVTVASIISTGGGWGHNVGMSQYGAHGRGLAGQTYLQILKTYYQGVDIGTYPITVRRQRGDQPPIFVQNFRVPNGQASLVVRPTTDMKRFRVTINGASLVFGPNSWSNGTFTLDISSYLVAGVNTIEYLGISRNGGATVNVNVN